MKLKRIVYAIKDSYALSLEGTHGIAHWARVMENGIKLAKLTGANPKVVRLFALFHDSKRLNEWDDPKHGLRGAEFVTLFPKTWLDLTADELELLKKACTHHTHGRTDQDTTVQTCWDSDRLDLGRCGVSPDPRFLCTQAAKRPEIIAWALDRGRKRIVPAFVKNRWGFDLV